MALVLPCTSHRKGFAFSFCHYSNFYARHAPFYSQDAESVTSRWSIVKHRYSLTTFGRKAECFSVDQSTSPRNNPKSSCTRCLGLCMLKTRSSCCWKRRSSASESVLADMKSEEPGFTDKNSSSGSKLALISLSDKQDLEYLAKGLRDVGFTLVSTGGTAAALESAGFQVVHIEQLTTYPEMLDGRVKTLHPVVHGGILARRDLESHMDSIKSQGIDAIDVVVVNLYPFFETVTAPGGASFNDGVEKIDIGGPAMIRAAAKNHQDVFVVVDPSDYPALIANLQGNAHENSLNFRKKLAWKAFQHVATYDSTVAEWFWLQNCTESGNLEFPPSLTIPLKIKSSLRYGENPHQKAAFYLSSSMAEVGTGGIATAMQYHGKEMSYNNYLDADAAWNCVCEFNHSTCVIVKHTNPCGVASGANILEAYHAAVKADPVSAFGGIVAFNVEVDESLASEIREFRSPSDGETRMFYEIIVAPKYSAKGLEVLKGKSKVLRILEAEKNGTGKCSFRQVGGGWLMQDSDDVTSDEIDFRVVSEKVPTREQVEDAKFAWLCVKHVKSNAIVVAKNNQMLGMGSGQPNRVKSLEIAMEKAGAAGQGAVLASDAFFPFAWNDAVESACKAGVSVIVQPGGSVRDQDAIDCCNKYGVAMLFTNIRHFRH